MRQPYNYIFALTKLDEKSNVIPLWLVGVFPTEKINPQVVHPISIPI